MQCFICLTVKWLSSEVEFRMLCLDLRARNQGIRKIDLVMAFSTFSVQSIVSLQLFRANR